MSYDDSSKKNSVINGIVALISLPLYPFKKMLDYRDAFDEEEKEDLE